MSKLSDAMMAQQGNLRAPPIGRIAPFIVTDQLSPLIGSERHREYSFSVCLSIKASIPEGDDGALSHAMKRSRRMVCEEVFGEFRESLCLIEVALMDYDTAKATDLLHDLRRRMFDD